MDKISKEKNKQRKDSLGDFCKLTFKKWKRRLPTVSIYRAELIRWY